MYFPEGIAARPTLSILTPLHKSGDDDQPKVCLATGFFPSTKNMNLILGNNDTVQLSTTKAALSSTRTYFFAGFSKENIKRCEMDGNVEPPVDDKDDSTDVSNCNNLYTVIPHIITVALNNSLNKYIYQWTSQSFIENGKDGFKWHDEK